MTGLSISATPQKAILKPCLVDTENSENEEQIYIPQKKKAKKSKTN